MKYILFALIILFPIPAHAQVVINGQEIIGAGPKGRYTLEQAERIAQDHIFDARQTEIVGTESFWQNGRFYHEIQVQVRDGSIYEVEINADTGALHEVEVEFLSANPSLPDDIISKAAARAAARSHVAHKVRGTFRERITREPEIMVHERHLAYRVGVKKLSDRYTVWVDALNGRVREMEKE